MNIFDYFGLVFILFFTIVSIIISTYILVYFSHTHEPSKPLSKIIRIFIVLTKSLIITIPFFLIIDLVSYNGVKLNVSFLFNFDLKYFWPIILSLATILLYINKFFIEFCSNVNL